MMKEPKENIIYTCEKHGEELYFKIKEHEKYDKDHVYCYFIEEKSKNKIAKEKMWVKILQGNQKKGMGVLVNEPVLVNNYKRSDIVYYETNEKNLTTAQGAKYAI